MIRKTSMLGDETTLGRVTKDKKYNSKVILLEDSFIKGQVNKSTRWMPKHQKPMKDVTSCEKLRGGANIQ